MADTPVMAVATASAAEREPCSKPLAELSLPKECVRPLPVPGEAPALAGRGGREPLLPAGDPAMWPGDGGSWPGDPAMPMPPPEKEPGRGIEGRPLNVPLLLRVPSGGAGGAGADVAAGAPAVDVAGWAAGAAASGPDDMELAPSSAAGRGGKRSGELNASVTDVVEWCPWDDGVGEADTGRARDEAPAAAGPGAENPGTDEASAGGTEAGMVMPLRPTHTTMCDATQNSGSERRPSRSTSHMRRMAEMASADMAALVNRAWAWAGLTCSSPADLVFANSSWCFLSTSGVTAQADAAAAGAPAAPGGSIPVSFGRGKGLSSVASSASLDGGTPACAMATRRSATKKSWRRSDRLEGPRRFAMDQTSRSMAFGSWLRCRSATVAAPLSSPWLSGLPARKMYS